MTLNNLVVFCYDFPHFKTKLGLQLLDIFGPKKCTILAAPWEKLKIKESKIRTLTNEEEYLHPREICKDKDWNYFACGHNSSEALTLLQEIKPSYGIIFGSRLLNTNIINSFEVGILNLHPGLLPENRGLNTIQNAVVKNIPQAVTLHFIDGEIDMGKMVYSEYINIQIPDSLFDIQKKITNTEMKILKNLFQNNFDLNDLISLNTSFPLNKILDEDTSLNFHSLFENYKENYENILNSHKK